MGRHRQCIERNSGKVPSCPGFTVGSHCFASNIKKLLFEKIFIFLSKRNFFSIALIHRLLILHDEIYKVQFYISISRAQPFFIFSDPYLTSDCYMFHRLPLPATHWNRSHQELQPPDAKTSCLLPRRASALHRPGY